MLHVETVEPGTLALLRQLMSMPALRDFSLVGGTALSLRFGHRTSIDLDLFSDIPFENSAMITAMEQEFGERFSYRTANSGFGLFCFVDGVKVDIVRYPHPRIATTETVDGIRLYADADIAAMKIQAMLGRGKKKDFWDLFELFQHYDLQQVMDWHNEKFPNQMLAIGIPHALLYFVDADDSDEPVSLKGQTWEGIKKAISRTVSKYLS
jgi:hypothetical protein